MQNIFALVGQRLSMFEIRDEGWVGEFPAPTTSISSNSLHATQHNNELTDKAFVDQISKNQKVI